MCVRNVFVSHAHADDERVTALKELLGHHGCEVRDSSIDGSTPNTAANPDYIKFEILAPRIRWAGAVIVLITRHTLASEWVEWEIGFAARENKRIVAVVDRGTSVRWVSKRIERFCQSTVGWNAKAIMRALEGEPVRRQAS